MHQEKRGDRRQDGDRDQTQRPTHGEVQTTPIKGFCDHVHLGNFSFDENRNYCDDDRGRRYFVDPGARPVVDLLEGHAEFVDRGRGRCDQEGGVEIKSLEPVLRWMRDHGKEMERKEIIHGEVGGPKRLSTHFVTRRGALHDMFLSAHFNNQYEFQVTQYKGTYYLEQMEILKDRENPNDPEGLQIFSGKQFARYCTIPYKQDLKADPNQSLPINDNVSYEAVMMSRCGDHRLMFSVEVHAEMQDRRRFHQVLRDPRPRHLSHVNIRTTRDFNDQAGIQPRNAFFRKKLLQFWSQNHIPGIPRIVLGWRDDNNHVITRVETYMTDDIPNIPACPWKPATYFSAVKNLLTQITLEVTTDDASVVHHLVLERADKVPYPLQVKQLSERRFKVARRTDSYRIIPDWFINDVLNEKV